MPTLNEQIQSLADPTALATLEFVLRQAGLAPDPFAAERSEEQLRQALTQSGLPFLEPPPEQPPSDGDIARATLIYLAGRDPAFRDTIEHALSLNLGQEQAVLRDAGTLVIGARVLLAFRTDLEWRKDPAKGW